MSSFEAKAANGARQQWHRPQVVELSPAEAEEVRARLLTDDERKEQFNAVAIAAITAWTTAEKERRRLESMSRQELAALDNFERLLAQRQSQFANLRCLYQQEPTMDCAPALLALITILSDNSMGCCTLSIGRLGEILSRGEDSIRDGLRRLVDAGVVHREKPGGAAWRYWPMVSKSFGDPKLSLQHFVDALSTPPAPRGRPSKNPSPSNPGLSHLTEHM